MIERLTVRDLILVDSLELEFAPGFNVLTGETGAGKSVLVGALSLLFGARGGGDLVRAGAEEAMVAGEFVVEGHSESLEWLAERDIEPVEGRILVRRTIRTTGRGTIYMQSVPMTLADLESFAGMLLDLHSQHEHQSLFVEANHRRLLDRFAGIESDVAMFGERFAALSAAQKELDELATRERDREREIEVLSFALEEIESAALRQGEVEELEQERDRMAQFERLASHIETIVQLLDDGEQAIVPAMKMLRQETHAVARIDEDLSGEAARIDNLFYELEDIAHTITGYRERLVYDPARLDEIENRLADLRRIFRKYGDGVEAVLAYQERADRDLTQLRTLSESREALRTRIAGLEQEITRRARDLHERRSVAASELQDRIERILRELAMGAAGFVVSVEQRTNDRGRLVTGPQGSDRVSFLISPNPGEPPRALSKIASGGEISRVMLAVKTVLADVDHTRALIFDEIDTGIGGQVAVALAAHMRELANRSQVICITHLATIAVRADNHIVVEKSSDDAHTRIAARVVRDGGRIREVARMLAGDVEGAPSLEHAEALLARYQRREANGQDQ